MNVLVRRTPKTPSALLAALFASALVSATLCHAQTTVTTDPVGYNTLTLPAGNSVRVNTFVQAKAFQGVASSITSASDSVITISGTSGLTSGTFNEGSSGPTYYLGVLSSGSGQGLIADVIASDTSTITVAANLPAFGVSGTTSFCIRPHTTLTSLLPASTTGLTPYVDTIKLFFPNNTNKSYLFTGSGSGWIDAGLGTDSGSQVIYPGQGFIITVQSAKSVPIFGSVKAGPTLIPLYVGSLNLVGNINPGASGTQTLANFNFPAVFTPYVDGVKLFNDDGSLQSPGSYLSSGTSMINAGTGSPSDVVQVALSNAVIVSVGQSKNWLMPSFYTSGQ